MKKLIKEINNKTIKEIEKELSVLNQEIAKLKLEKKVNPQKDTNIIVKRRKRLAKLLTILTEKRESEKLQKVIK